MNDDHETPEEDFSEETSADSSLAQQLKKIQEHLGFLERKIDTLIENSQRRPERQGSGESRSGFRPREFGGGGGGFRSGGSAPWKRGHQGGGRRDDREGRRPGGRPSGGRDSFRSERPLDGNRAEGNRAEGNRGEARPFFKKGRRR